MSINAIRGLILLANVALLALIGWLCYDTFVTVDKQHYFVEPPKPEDYRVVELAVDESQQKKDLYKAISKVFDRPPPPPPVVDTPKPPEAPKPDPSQIQVLALQYSPNQERSSALLNAPPPFGKEPRFFQPGLDLGSPGLGFEAYAGCKLKAITADEVIIVDPKGKEVKLPGPRPKEGGG